MKRLALLALLCMVFTVPALHAQSCTPTTNTACISGTMQLPSGAGAGHSYMRIQLMYCGGNSGAIPGVATISTAPFDVQTSTGAWATSIYGNDKIQCATVSNSTLWRLTPYINGAAGPALTYKIQSNTTFAVDGPPSCTPVVTFNCVQDYAPVPGAPAPIILGANSVFGLTGVVCPPAAVCTVNSSLFDLSGSTTAQAPTPASSDNSSKIATTAFVKAQAGGGPNPNNVDYHFWNSSAGTVSFSPTYGSPTGLSVANVPYSNGAAMGVVAATATHPTYARMANAGGASAGSSGGMYEYTPTPPSNNIIGNIILSTLISWQAKVVLNASFNQGRTWIGLNDHGGSFQTANTNSPTTYNIVGFRYDPAEAHDLVWKVFLGGLVTPIIINTGVSIQQDGLPHVFKIAQATAGTLAFSIDGTQIATSSSFSGLTNGFYSFVWVDNDDASTISWAATTAFGTGAEIFSSPNFWIATIGGTSGGGSNPLVPSSPGTIIVDGGITWKCVGNGVYVPTNIGLPWLYWESTT